MDTDVDLVSDYDIRSNSIQSLERYLVKFGKHNLSTGNDQNVNIMTTNDYQVFDENYLNSILNRFNITYITGYSILIKETKSKLIVKNPQQSALDLLKNKFNHDLENRLYLICKQLKELNIPIYIKRMLKTLNKDLHAITIIDICNELIDPFYKYYISEFDIMFSVIKPIFDSIPLTRYQLPAILDELDYNKETLLLYNPHKKCPYCNRYLEEDYIDGMLISDNNANDDNILLVDKKIYQGSGKFIY